MTTSAVDRSRLDSRAFVAFIGIDWADEEHAVCLLFPEADAAEWTIVPQQAEALDAWVAGLRTRFGDRPVAVCLEVSRGPLAYALMKYDGLVLFPINPKQLAKYREAFSPSGAKDDPGDAELLARFLREHHRRLRPWRPDDDDTRSLRLLSESRRAWVDQRTAAGNQLLRHLKEVHPLALRLLGKHLYAEAFLALLARFPTQRELQRASPKQLARWLPKRRRVADDPPADGNDDPRIVAIRQAAPLVTDEPVLQSGRLAIEQFVKLIRQLNAAITAYDQQINAIVARHPDAELFRSFPGAGEALLPRLVAAFGDDRQRFASAADLQALSGIAPITQRSGKSHVVRMRRACPKFLRQTFHEFARCSLRKSTWAKAYVAMLRHKGHGFHSALRPLAYKWLRVLFQCWKSRQPYDEARYLDSLGRKCSPIIPFLTVPKAVQNG